MRTEPNQVTVLLRAVATRVVFLLSQSANITPPAEAAAAEPSIFEVSAAGLRRSLQWGLWLIGFATLACRRLIMPLPHLQKNESLPHRADIGGGTVKVRNTEQNHDSPTAFPLRHLFIVTPTFIARISSTLVFASSCCRAHLSPSHVCHSVLPVTPDDGCLQVDEPEIVAWVL